MLATGTEVLMHKLVSLGRPVMEVTDPQPAAHTALKRLMEGMGASLGWELQGARSLPYCVSVRHMSSGRSCQA